MWSLIRVFKSEGLGLVWLGDWGWLMDWEWVLGDWEWVSGDWEWVSGNWGLVERMILMSFLAKLRQMLRVFCFIFLSKVSSSAVKSRIWVVEGERSLDFWQFGLVRRYLAVLGSLGSILIKIAFCCFAKSWRAL